MSNKLAGEILDANRSGSFIKKWQKKETGLVKYVHRL